MPAVSKAQRRFFGMVEHDPNASPAVAQAASTMTKGQAHDFAATKEKGLPMHKHKKKHEKKEGRQAKPRGGNPY